MSDIIRLLPESIANQIAAGEVVPAPAYLVKELVENSIDAGAKQIQIEVVGAGRQSISVTDDGKGMSPTDARMALSVMPPRSFRRLMTYSASLRWDFVARLSLLLPQSVR